MNPTTQQQSNALNPTPYSVALPQAGALFRTTDNPYDVYQQTGNTYTSAPGFSTGVYANANLRDSAGKVYNAGDLVTGDDHGVTILDPNFHGGYATSKTYGADKYNQQFGAGAFNNLPVYNLADIQDAIAHGTFQPGQTITNNNTPNSLAPGVLPGSQPARTGLAATAESGAVALPNNGGANPMAAQAGALGNSGIPNPNGQGNLSIVNPNANFQATGLNDNQRLTPTGIGNPPTMGDTSSGSTNTQSGLNNTQTGTSTNSSNTAGGTSGGDANSLLQNYLQSLNPTSTELGLQQQLNQLQGQKRLANSIAGYEGQPINTTFIGGQEDQYNKLNDISQQNITSQLALEQSKRQSAIDIAKATLDYNKPVSETYGAQLVNPNTGQVINAGLFGSSSGISGKINPATGLNPASSSADILGYLSQNGVQITRYNMPGLVNAVQNGATAQDIISGKVNVAAQTAAGTSGATYKQGAIPGTYVQPNPSSANTILGTQGSSTGAYQAGQLTQLLQSQGKTADDATLNSLWQQYGNGGTYNNDTAHNGVIYNAMTGGQSGNTGGGSASSGNQYSNAASIRADAQSLQQQQEYADTTQRAFNTANANLQAILPFMQQAGVNNTSTIPLINSLTNRVKSGLTDPGTIAAFKSALAGLRAEYSQVLSRGGARSVETDNQALALIPDDLTPSQLQQVATRLNTEGTNAVQEAQSQVQAIKNRMSGGTSGSSTGSSNPLGI